MKRAPLAAAALTLSLLASPGVAYATSSPGGAGGAGGSGGSGGSSGSAGQAGSSGTGTANCAGAIKILISWFGSPGTVTQCK
jgi:hypothetical protein